MALSVLAYLLLVRLYGRDEALTKEWSLFKLKERFIGRWRRMPCSVLSGNGSVSGNNSKMWRDVFIMTRHSNHDIDSATLTSRGAQERCA